MMAAVEDFVQSVPGSAPGPPARFPLRQLGAACYGCRENASRRLERLCRDDPRPLFWGRRSADPEVRVRANNVLRRLSVCDMCGGDGLCRIYRGQQDQPGFDCPNCGLWSWSHTQGPGECRACTGAGSAWPLGAWD